MQVCESSETHSCRAKESRTSTILCRLPQRFWYLFVCSVAILVYCTGFSGKGAIEHRQLKENVQDKVVTVNSFVTRDIPSFTLLKKKHDYHYKNKLQIGFYCIYSHNSDGQLLLSKEINSFKDDFQGTNTKYSIELKSQGFDIFVKRTKHEIGADGRQIVDRE